MMRWCRRRLVLVIVLAVALLIVGALWFAMPPRLSPLERTLVGKWYYTASLSGPDDTTVICHRQAVQRVKELAEQQQKKV